MRTGALLCYGFLTFATLVSSQSSIAQEQPSQAELAEARRAEEIRVSNRIQNQIIQMCFNLEYGHRDMARQLEARRREVFDSNLSRAEREKDPSQRPKSANSGIAVLAYTRDDAREDDARLREQAHAQTMAYKEQYETECHSRLFVFANAERACHSSSQTGAPGLDIKDMSLCRDLERYEAEEIINHEFVEGIEQIKQNRRLDAWAPGGYSGSTSYDGYSAIAHNHRGNFRYSARIVTRLNRAPSAVPKTFLADIAKASQSIGLDTEQSRYLLPVLDISFSGLLPTQVFPNIVMTSLDVAHPDKGRIPVEAATQHPNFTTALDTVPVDWGKAPGSGPYKHMTARDNLIQAYTQAVAQHDIYGPGNWSYLLTDRLLDAMKEGKFLIFTIVYSLDGSMTTPQTQSFYISLEGFSKNADLYTRFVKSQPLRARQEKLRIRAIAAAKTERAIAEKAIRANETANAATLVRELVSAHAVTAADCGAMPARLAIGASDSRVNRARRESRSWLSCYQVHANTMERMAKRFITAANLAGLPKYPEARSVAEAHIREISIRIRSDISRTDDLSRQIQNRNAKQKRREEKRWREERRARDRKERRQRRDRDSRNMWNSYNITLNNSFLFSAQGFGLTERTASGSEWSGRFSTSSTGDTSGGGSAEAGETPNACGLSDKGLADLEARIGDSSNWESCPR